MSIQREITRLESAKSAIAAAIAGKGVTVPDGTLLDGMAALIEAIEAGGGADISPWSDLITFSITPAEDLTGKIDFTSFIPGRTQYPNIFILGQRAIVSDSSHVESMARISTWNSWQRLYYKENNPSGSYPVLRMLNGKFTADIGTYKLAAGVPYWGVMLWHQ